ncbi:hypothetical protein PICMEDRAFT_71518 [Pichia membranifaciens NRRL Y-2026]|uniref:Nudix hydrolase domain-containing protein n=1 Tax=Pichia membranifaciens NRRL Y-2026 TaxID=763406 RepID=A0A1E3NMX2_9ASCO|nr:hypothetical protein PICMEDRAFT_71518 [Pichia membranifaciens NRRL Y-2026]ODQ47446.1 hypothetical protein PICMEDRAFT_71518 [Pichia membranifaciens NRRL Y-2026]
MQSCLELIKKVDVVPYPHEAGYTEFKQSVYSLVSHDGSFQLGFMITPVVNALEKYPQFFEISALNNTVQFHPSLDTIEAREQALELIGNTWRSATLFETLYGWRNEKYTIFSKDRKPYFHLERAMCPLFGLVMYGVHINGYVKSPSGEYKMWVPRRAADKPTYPGMLDNTVAGGLGYPYGPLETCFKECYEEAGLLKEYVSKKLSSCGVVSYLYQVKPGDYFSEAGLIQPEVEYVYDLEMDPDITPHPVDHESEDFRLMSIPEIEEKLLLGEFKDNCAAIIVDFMIRHSIITPEEEHDFIEITNRLHRFVPFPLRPL